jgi:hypothetical protein
MTDIKTEIADILAEIDDKEFAYDPQRIYQVLTLACSKLRKYEYEIQKLQEQNIDMGWKLNPDRMGGQFSEWETNRRGDEWS